MKKRQFGIIAAIILAFCLVIPAAAETFEGDEGWSVTFTKDAKMDCNFKTEQIDDAISEKVQPGDTVIFEIALKNEYPGEVDWWMQNKVLESLEDNSKDTNTKGGGYQYKLDYKTSTNKSRALFDMDNVGGDDTEAGIGLNQVVNGLPGAHTAGVSKNEKDYFYLDTFNGNGEGTLTLTVSLDGDTQGNDYQDTLAQLAMNFAVEIVPEPETQTETTSEPDTTTRPDETTSETVTTQTTTPTSTTQRTTTYKGTTTGYKKTVKTGDQTNTAMYFIMLGIAGVIILAVAIVMFRRRRKEDAS